MAMDRLPISGFALEAARTAAAARRVMQNQPIDAHDTTSARVLADCWAAAHEAYRQVLKGELRSPQDDLARVTFVVEFTDARCGPEASAEEVCSELARVAALLTGFAESGADAHEVLRLATDFIDEVDASTGSDGCVVVPL